MPFENHRACEATLRRASDFRPGVPLSATLGLAGGPTNPEAGSREDRPAPQVGQRQRDALLKASASQWCNNPSHNSPTLGAPVRAIRRRFVFKDDLTENYRGPANEGSDETFRPAEDVSRPPSTIASDLVDYERRLIDEIKWHIDQASTKLDALSKLKRK